MIDQTTRSKSIDSMLDEAFLRLSDYHPLAARIMKMRFTDQKSYEEIATALKVSPGVAKVLAYRGRQWLQRELNTMPESTLAPIESLYGLAQDGSKPTVNNETSEAQKTQQIVRPPLNAEYVLYLLLSTDERDAVIGDLNEVYARIFQRFNKRRADIWYYKQIAGSLFPLIRRALLRIATLVWLGRILRRLIS